MVAQTRLNGRMTMYIDTVEKLFLAKIITGIDSLTQLKENNIASNSNNINRKTLDSWWKNLPIYPVKLLNPSLW